MPRLSTDSWCNPDLAASRPAIHSAVRNAMATSKPYVGRKKPPIWKTSGNILSVRRLALELHKIQQQQAAADHDGAVGGVKRRPLVAADIEQQKIRHRTPAHAVENVADRASQDQGEGDGGLPVEARRAP